MSYESVDKLQNVLAQEVFAHTKEAKKAAGRALGTLVEIISYYLLKTWGVNHSVSIERGLEEYGNPEITHNVEYSLHPVSSYQRITVPRCDKSITANVVYSTLLKMGVDKSNYERLNNSIYSKGVLRNGCTIGKNENNLILCCIESEDENNFIIGVYEQNKKPYAVIECKRVGVEEGMKKGPQTIEKAKQGAYVARAASSLQKIRTESGDLYGIVYKSDGSYLVKPFHQMLEEIIQGNEKDLLRRFILTIGLVSNHGNWFTAENQNKELKVLAQSYDWLIFLTDAGLSSFIENLLLHPTEEYKHLRKIFLSSYAEGKSRNQFTKVQMNVEADKLLLKYFNANIKQIEGWFNIITPSNKSLGELKEELILLGSKNWNEISK